MKTFVVNGASVGVIAIIVALFASMGGFIFGFPFPLRDMYTVPTNRTATRVNSGLFEPDCLQLAVNFLLAFFISFITGDIHYGLGFVFAGCNLQGAFVVLFFLCLLEFHVPPLCKCLFEPMQMNPPNYRLKRLTRCKTIQR